MNPAHLLGAGLLLLTVLSVVVGVLLHQRAELKHRAAMRITDSEIASITTLTKEVDAAQRAQYDELAKRLKDAENELVRITNRNGR